MKRFFITIISSCTMLMAYAQEEIVLDSISNIPKVDVSKQLILEKPPIFDDSFLPEKLNLFDHFQFDQPLLPTYSKNLDFLKPLGKSTWFSVNSLSNNFIFSPYFTNGKIHNQAAYRLNDRFLVGGNSFGARSVFDPPRINSSIQDMNMKGASMFLQYKVSKSVKVEGRVSISNNPNRFEP